MDCKTARTLLEYARPRLGELDIEESDALTSHLADCTECGAIGQAERKLDDHIGRAMRAVRPPDGLRERISLRLAAQNRMSRRRHFAKLALAASILLTLLGLAFWPLPLIGIDLEKERNRAENLPRSAAEVEERFVQEHGIRLKAPAQYNFDLLTYCDMGELQGQRVPMLEFKNGAALARIYILDARRFDMQKLQNADPSGRVTFEFTPDDPFGYIIECFGGTSEQFKSRESFPAT